MVIAMSQFFRALALCAVSVSKVVLQSSAQNPRSAGQVRNWVWLVDEPSWGTGAESKDPYRSNCSRNGRGGLLYRAT